MSNAIARKRALREGYPWVSMTVIFTALGLLVWQWPAITKLEDPLKWIVVGSMGMTVLALIVTLGTVSTFRRHRQRYSANTLALADIHTTSLPVDMNDALFLFLVETEGDHGRGSSLWQGPNPTVDARTYFEALRRLTKNVKPNLIRQYAAQGQPPQAFPEATPPETRRAICQLLRQASGK